MDIIGWNGKVVPVDQAAVSVMDHGFLYGMTLFETMRTYGGRPFLLERHMERLTSACNILGIDYRMDTIQIEQVERHIREVMDANGLKEAYVRYTVSAGENGFGLPIGEYVRPNVLVLVKPLPAFLDELYEQGKPLQLLHTRRNGPEADVRFKSGQYMNNIVAKRELVRLNSSAQGAEGLMLDQNGHISEGIVSNVFFVQDGRLYTPDLSTGILPGITRQWVIELAGQANIDVEEGKYEWKRLWHADEVFLTTSVQELVPVTSLIDTEGQAKQLGGGQAGDCTRMLLSLYRATTVRII
ncbi:aminotransferase class IV [Paenibacillus alvei]|uniref:Aminotransferase class IV n=1 Tax=Paenibacillus alvei TaxID=44250 RepID=A0ABT4H2X3_PAEAL|nr:MULTISPECIES: aminotransferase class IV [Paenibacillus]EJW18886.1 aminotransferase class IV [Paenibacillus alvei DSM 29]MCY7485472.1 aminotransferase class IV [Paenibacillus alvei]MCY9541157.1 aminotransferase class IV [Paenibacillus alvei]MCY9705417.1 aminotransferase class IV [Paenibacillus alvei]MCY9736911.1 aminotransferase class IV [Paenibacillus alvei]